jgi:hypothetical protein
MEGENLRRAVGTIDDPTRLFNTDFRSAQVTLEAEG